MHTLQLYVTVVCQWFLYRSHSSNLQVHFYNGDDEGCNSSALQPQRIFLLLGQDSQEIAKTLYEAYFRRWLSERYVTFFFRGVITAGYNNVLLCTRYVIIFSAGMLGTGDLSAEEIENVSSCFAILACN